MASFAADSRDVLTWLLDEADPGPRFLALRDLVQLPADDSGLVAARAAAHMKGPIAAILSAMDDEGFWVKPGYGYSPKYRSTVWSVISLAQLGASAAQDERIGRACTYVLEHTLIPDSRFATPNSGSEIIDCLQGNLCAALVDLGCEDSRVDTAFEWMARSVMGDNVGPRREREFACKHNDGLPCAWGAIKVLLALGKLPAIRRTPAVDRAIDAGVAFLFSSDPALARYPSRRADRPSPNWWKFGFPLFYVADVLQLAEAMIALGYADDPRLSHVLSYIREKQDDTGRWPLEYLAPGKMWAKYGTLNRPNKWVTLRTLRVLNVGIARGFGHVEAVSSARRSSRQSPRDIPGSATRNR